MTSIITLSEIEGVLRQIDAVAQMEQAFKAYSQGLVDVPPVGELLFNRHRGEMHLKYGTIRGSGVFVVKIATGFYDNPELGLPSSGGVVLVFSARSGVPLAVLLDEGRLTDIRTAAAGAVCAKHLAPYDPGWIGVCGSGLQARLQLRLLLPFTTCRNVVVWARNGSKAAECAADIAQLGYNTKVASSPAALAVCARLIITTTASDRPYLMADDIQPGTHITAVGSDSADKIELDPAILGRASSVIADSRSQCRERGEIHHAIASGAVRAGDIVELGEIIGKKRGSRDPHAITIADLTGVAAQDIMMAEAVCRGLQVSGV